MTIKSSSDEAENNNASQPNNGDVSSAETELRSSAARYRRVLDNRELYQKEQAEKRKRLYLTFTFLFALFILLTTSVANPGIYKIEPQTLLIINQAFNAMVILVIPFLLGSVGAIARILISGVQMVQNGTLIVSSGLMAMFSWIGIKSGILLAIAAPHIERKEIEGDIVLRTVNDFYTMALVAILVGMFSTNLYIFIKQRVEQLTQQERNSEEKLDK